MRYENEQLGFSFDLPERWRKDGGNLTLTFFGPKGQIGSSSEVIQLKIGTILPQYQSPESREAFLSEPGATITRKRIGDEDNVVVLEKSSNGEISAVRDGIHYNFTYAKDSETIAAIDLMCGSARFGTTSQAEAAIQSWSDPKRQAMAKVLRSGSAEEAREILADTGMPSSVQRPGYSIHSVSNRHGKKPTKKWWEFWK